MSINYGDVKIEARATNDGYLETNDISILLDVSRQTVLYYIREGKLKSEYNGGLHSQRKRVKVEDFKEFLLSKPKYYARVYGEFISEEEPQIEEVVVTSEDDSDKTLSTLFAKLDSIDKMLEEHKKEIDKLETQKLALEEVIEMF